MLFRVTSELENILKETLGFIKINKLFFILTMDDLKISKSLKKKKNNNNNDNNNGFL